jgi:hypothetical protein
MIKVDNLAQVNRQIDDWFANVEAETQDVAKAIAAHALRWIATQSPQYSGDFAGNWKIGIDKINTDFEPYVFTQGKPWVAMFRQGSGAAVQRSLSLGLPLLSKFELGQSINISNSAAHYYFVMRMKGINQTRDLDDPATLDFQKAGKDHYAWKIEDNKIKFRPENGQGGNVRQRFLNYFGSAYAVLTPKDVKGFSKAGRKL